MIACAADEIICDVSSIVGSIGVVGGSFGFDKLIDKLGIERRLYTSGERKAMLDPFLPEKPEDVERLKAIQKDIHEHFIALVKERRGDAPQRPRKGVVLRRILDRRRSGRARPADGIGDLRTILARALRREGAHAADRRRPQFRSGAQARARHRALPGADDLISALEERAYWSRYGL